MASKKKLIKSKLIPGDLNELMNSSAFLNDSPSKKKSLKRPQPSSLDDENSIDFVKQTTKKKTAESHYEATQKVLHIMNEQLSKRQKTNDELLSFLVNVLTDMKADDEEMTKNEQKFEQLMGALMKYMQQSTVARKEKLKRLEDTYNLYKKRFDDMYNEEKSETKQITEELNDGMKKLQHKLVMDATRTGWETIRKTIFNAMHNGI